MSAAYQSQADQHTAVGTVLYAVALSHVLYVHAIVMDSIVERGTELERFFFQN